jgi:hypothetical protein
LVAGDNHLREVFEVPAVFRVNFLRLLARHYLVHIDITIGNENRRTRRKARRRRGRRDDVLAMRFAMFTQKCCEVMPTDGSVRDEVKR